MNKKQSVQLTEGSRYRIFSIGGRERMLETEGVFRGFTTFGVDEGALIIELGAKHDDMQGTTRILPLTGILAIDILDAKPKEKRDEEREASHYYG